MFNPLISVYVKDIHGWFEIATECYKWDGWRLQDKNWIDELLKTDNECLIVGNTMYHYVNENK
jgi:hypothetical protein